MGKRGRGKQPDNVVLVSHGKGEVKRTQQTPFDPAGSNDVEYIVREIKAKRVRPFSFCAAIRNKRCRELVWGLGTLG